MNKTILSAIIASLTLLATSPAFASDMPGEKIFKTRCTMCHALDTKKFGPAVKDMSTDAAVLKQTVTDGRKAMPSFKNKLTAEQIDQVVAYLRSQHK